MPEFIIETQQGRVRRITLNRPEKHNAMDAQMQADLFELVDAAVRDPDTGVVVLAGAGKSFCSGADMRPTREPPGGGKAASVSDAAADMTNNRAHVDRWLSLWSAPKPLIAQVHGHCIGIANELAACCDLVVCGESARFGMPEAREFALPPTLAFWPLRIGLARTKELLFTGRVFSSGEAERMGLVNRAVAPEDVLPEARELAQQVAAAGPQAVRGVKRSLAGSAPPASTWWTSAPPVWSPSSAANGRPTGRWPRTRWTRPLRWRVSLHGDATPTRCACMLGRREIPCPPTRSTAATDPR